MADGTTFQKKLISLSVQLANNPQTNQPNTFAESGTDTSNISGLRTSVRITNSGAPSNATAHVMVWGLTESLVNQLSTLGMVLNLVPKNTLTISAGTDPQALTTVFIGTIVAAYLDTNNKPDVPFILECQSGLADMTANVPPTSIAGKADVAQLMSGFARARNLGFENNGVNISLSNPYYSGSVVQQQQQCAEDADINAEVINGNVLAIWPKNGSRNTNNVPVITSPANGGNMIRSPSFTQQGILIFNLFDPTIAFGQKVQVIEDDEALQKANGTWTVTKLDLALDSMVFGGLWEMALYCYNPNSPNPIIPPP